MKAAVVLGAGQTPRYADFSEPMPDAGESRITVTAAAISQVVRSRAPASITAHRAGFPSSPASMARDGLMTGLVSISSCPARPMAAWPNAP